jgi:hydrogenase expression/formation protein HypD
LREPFEVFDAAKKYRRADHLVDEPDECVVGLVLQGLKRPHYCLAFGTRCTPEHPFRATLVSSEGSCAAHHRYRRRGATELVKAKKNAGTARVIAPLLI